MARLGEWLIFFACALPIVSPSLPVTAQTETDSPKIIASAKSLALASPSLEVVPAPHNRQNQSAQPKSSQIKEARTHFERGLNYKQKHDPNKALIEFLKATEADPELVRGFYEQALIYREQSNLKLAQSSLQCALAVNPNYNEARILLAAICIEEGNLPGAMTQLSRSLGITGSAGQNHDTSSDATAPETNDLPLPLILQSIHAAVYNKFTTNNTEKTASEPLKAPAATATEPAPSEHSDNLIASAFGFAKPWRFFGQSNSTSNKTSNPEAKAEKITSENKIKTGEKNKKAAHGKLIGNWFKSKKQSTKSDAAAKSESKKNTKKRRKHKRAKETPALEAGAITTTTAEKLPDVLAAFSQHSHEAPPAQAKIVESEELKATAAPTTVDQPEASKQQAFQLPSMAEAGQVLSEIGKSIKLHTAEPSHAQTKTLDSRTNIVLDQDEWAQKLKDLVEHGTGSLKEGEAFMFAEDTGEASLFLADGTIIRRHVAYPKDKAQVVRERRPDILLPEEVLYNLSLLGKLIPREDTISAPDTVPAVARQDFKADNIMGGSQNFWGWLKGVFK